MIVPTLQLIQPLQDQVNSIREELFEKTVYETGSERYLYGRFEEAYKLFVTENFKNGTIVNKIDFFNKKQSELEEIAFSIKPIEEKILKETGNQITFHSIMFSVSNVLELINQKINTESITKKNYKLKRKLNEGELTYNFQLERFKLNDFYKLLRKSKLIAKSNKYKD